MYKRVKRIATLALILILIVLFTVPRRYLARVTDDMLSLSAQAATSARANDGKTAQYLAEMELLFDSAEPKLQLFMHHGAVDEVTAALGACQPLLPHADLLSALNVLNAALSHLAGLERLQLINLL